MTKTLMTFREALIEGKKALSTHRCDGADPGLESEAILAHATRLTRERLFLAFNQTLTPAETRRFSALIARRAKHEPLAWLLGSGWFMGREFTINKHTLIPRPATESVVEAALLAAGEQRIPLAIDVGTGSGCIAISLAHGLPRTHVIGTDASAGALRAARKNAQALRASNVQFKKGDLLAPAISAIRKNAGDTLIVANLPYLPTAMSAGLSRCVLREPRTALFGGKDGFSPSLRLIGQIAKLYDRPADRPNKKSILAFEILPRQFVPLADAIKKSFPAATVTRIGNHQKITVGLLALLR